MSEYITFDIEPTEDPTTVIIRTNQTLATEGREVYPDMDSGEEGSPIAQLIFAIDGVEALIIDGTDLTITHSPELELFHLVDEIRTALTDFFL